MDVRTGEALRATMSGSEPHGKRNADGITFTDNRVSSTARLLEFCWFRPMSRSRLCSISVRCSPISGVECRLRFTLQRPSRESGRNRSNIVARNYGAMTAKNQLSDDLTQGGVIWVGGGLICPIAPESLAVQHSLLNRRSNHNAQASRRIRISVVKHPRRLSEVHDGLMIDINHLLASSPEFP